jgi:hypothetical protein
MFTTLFLATMFLGSQDVKEDYPPPGNYPHNFEISQKYDKFRNRTTLHLDLGVVWRNEKNKLELNVYQSFNGEGRTDPNGVPSLMFLNVGHDGWRYLSFHPITFMVDGKRMEYEPDHSGDIETGYVLEHMWVHPTKKQFLDTIYAKTVEIKVGIDESQLGDSHLNALKDFASLIKNPDRIVHPPYAACPTRLKGELKAARSYEAQGRDSLALDRYTMVIEGAKGSEEADEAAKGIKRLTDPALLAARKKAKEAEERAKAAQMEADEKAKAERQREAKEKSLRRQREAKEKSLRLKIEQDLRLGRSLEGMNIKGALSYYREIVNLAKGLEPEPPELKKAIDRIKALEAKK